jgi:hypothetical protein
MGRLAYMHRRATVHSTGKWSKDDAVHISWDNKTGDPIDNYYRYDLTFSAFAIAIMAEHTPAWREAYTVVMDTHLQRFLEYWTFFDWVQNKGEDPDRLNYPDWWYDVLIPKGMKGKYDSPGWAGNGLRVTCRSSPACTATSPGTTSTTTRSSWSSTIRWSSSTTTTGSSS